MAGDSTYDYAGSHEFSIENGILRGKKLNYLTGHNSFGELVLEHLRAEPNFIGEIDGPTGREINFAEMETKSVLCSMWMQKQGIRAGDVVGICTHNQIDMYVPCFASLFLGAVYNPWWHTGITKELAKHFFNVTKPKVLFVDESSAPLVLEAAEEMKMHPKFVVFGKLSGLQSLDDVLETQDPAMVSKFNCTELSSLDAPAVILYTSGTTGFPKGALHSNRALFGNVRVWCEAGKVDGTMISLIFSPLAWATGVAIMLRAILQFETRVIHPDFHEETTLQLLEKYKVNWLLLGTSVLVRLIRCPSISKYDLKALKVVSVTGAVVRKEIQETMASCFPETECLQAYGSTEFGGVAIFQTGKPSFGSCGTVAPNASLKVIDPDSGRILGPNEHGEAVLKSPYMMIGYYDNPEATRATIDADGWLHSGDIIHYDESGEIYVSHRIKEIIKYRGNHVSPTMLEKILLQHPGVSEVAVLGVPHKIDDEHPIAFVVKTPGSEVTKKELEDLVANTLPDYMRLRGGVEFIEKMPCTGSGKTAKQELKKLLKYQNS